MSTSEVNGRDPEFVFCTRCGQRVSASFEFCTSCGAPLKKRPKVDQRKEQPAGERGIAASPQPEPVRRPDEKTIEMLRPVPDSQPTTPPYAPSVPPTPSATLTTPMPRATEPPVQPPVPKRARKRKRHRGLVALIVVLVLLAALGLCAFFAWKTGMLDTLVQTVTGASSEEQPVRLPYASTEPVLVARDTDIVPLRADGEPLSSYRVRLKEADDLSGKAMGIDDFPRLTVGGPDGFSMESFGLGVSDGTYWLCVTDDQDKDYDLPPVTVDSSQTESLPGSIDVAFPKDADEPVARQGEYQCFANTLNNLIATHGDASLTVVKARDDLYLAWVAGTSYADIVDFGDGVERLVVAWCTDPSLAEAGEIEVEEGTSMDEYMPSFDRYRIAVYEYDRATDQARSVCEAFVGNDGASGGPQVRFVTNPADGSVCLLAGAQDAKGGSSEMSAYGITDDGSFGVVEREGKNALGWATSTMCRISNKALTQDAAVGDASSDELSCEETAQTVHDLAARLQTLTSR